MSIEPWIIISYLVIGIFAGIIGGLLGLGGGIIIVPALYFIYLKQGFPPEILMQMAIATSLLTIVLTSVSSTLAHHRRGAVYWHQVTRLTPGIILGGTAGGTIAHYLHSDTLRILFGLFELYIACQILFSIKPKAHRRLPNQPGMVLAGMVIGSLSTILGIGGGTLTVPFLLWCNINIRNAVATSAACGFPIALAGSISMVITGWSHPDLPAGSTGYVYWPAAFGIMLMSVSTAPLGARIAHAIPVDMLGKLFAFILVLVGIKILTGY